MMAALHRRRGTGPVSPSRPSGEPRLASRDVRLRLTAALVALTLCYGAFVLLHPASRPDHLPRVLHHTAFAVGEDGSSEERSSGSDSTGPISEGSSTSAGVTALFNSSMSSSAGKALKHPVWWAGPVWSQSGYGSEAVSFLTGLVDTGLVRPSDLYVTHSGDGLTGGIQQTMEQSASTTIQSLEWDHQQTVLSKAQLARTAVVVCHSFPDCWERPGEYNYPTLPGCPCPTEAMKGDRSVYKIGRSMFEMDRLHDHLALHAREMDELWVPSQFNVDSFAAAGIPREKIFIVPQSVNLTIFDRTRHEALDLKNMGRQLCTGTEAAGGKKKRFTFLSVFKWEGRKGWEILLRAFLEEFKASEAVDLLIVTHPFMEDVGSWVDKIRDGIRHRAKIEGTPFEKMPRVYIKSDYVPDSDYPRLYKACDALVVPTRGEGWGRPQMEAMAMEMPCISTNWSGPTAFMNEANSYPLRSDGLVAAENDGPSFFWFFGGLSWAAPSPTHLRELMRRVVSHPAEAAVKGAEARRYLQAEFSPEAVARKLFEQIERVQKLLAEREARAARVTTGKAREVRLRKEAAAAGRKGGKALALFGNAASQELLGGGGKKAKVSAHLAKLAAIGLEGTM